MKKIFLFTVFFFLSSFAFAQSDSTYINQINDSTFVKIDVSFDEEGRETSIQKTYYDSLGFSDLLFDFTVNADKSFQQSEKQLLEQERNILFQKRVFNFLRKDFKAFTGKNYATELTKKLKGEFSGDWRLRIGNDIFNLSATPSNLILNDSDSDKRARIIFLQVGKLTLTKSGNSNFFFPDDVELQKNENEIWVGTTTIDNVETRVILRKKN